MQDYFKPKTWLITALMLAAALGLSSAIVFYEFGYQKNIKISRAGASDNVSGWAWNSNVGWISFNCLNDSPPCVNSNYGVNIDSGTGNFSGYAWSSGAGWISFNRRTCVGGSDNGAYCMANNNCTSNSCSLSGPGATGEPLFAPFDSPASLKYVANYDSGTGAVRGWAKILSLGDNGWIKFNDASWPNGVTINPVDLPVVADMIAPNWNYLEAGAGALRANLQFSFVSGADDFGGWAWNGNDDFGGLGWISFNCDHTNDGTLPPDNINTCGVSNYKVVRGITVGGSSGLAYQIIVTKADDTAVLDTGKCTGYNTPSADPIKCKFDISCLVNGSSCQYQLAQADGLDYSTAYKWSVKVWDEHDVASDLTPYNANPDFPPEADDRGTPPINNNTFTTYKHEFPRPSATWFIINPSRGEEVKFIATSSQRFFSAQYSGDPAPYTPVGCQENTCDWLWTTTNVNDDIKNPNASTTIIIFSGVGANTATLRLTDQGDTGGTPYDGKIDIPVNINVNLPKWKEVKPE